ncbi:MAG: hypothetical protein ACTHKF_08105 [Candidatus Nitrosocosmicus sp.]
MIIITITVTLNLIFQGIFAQEQQSNSCPQTMSMGATYEDKQGCIRPCPTSSIQGQIPTGCPQIPQSQQPDQSAQQQQQSPRQSDQNGPLTTTNNPNTAPSTSDKETDKETAKKIEMGGNNFGPINTELKDRLNDKIRPCANDITGKWIANDGGVYYIQQIGNSTRWFGSTLFNDNAINSNKGFEYANEATGGIGKHIDGTTQIVLYWDDITVSDNHFKGTLNLLVDPSGSKLTKISATGGFGPSEWTRQC